MEMQEETSLPLHFQSYGSSNLPALIFLHGFMGEGNDWQSIASKFKDTHRCILIDLPGHGKSISGVEDYELSYELISRSINQLVCSLKLTSFSIVGYSMGGRIALHYALSHPSQIRTLTLINANPGIIDKQEREERLRQDIELSKRILSEPLKDFLDYWYTLPIFASLRNEHKQSKLLDSIKQNKLSNLPAMIAKVIVELSPGRQKPLWDYLSGLKIPVLLISGDKDPKYHLILNKMGKLLPKVTRISFPNAGHVAHLENQEEFIESLKGFLSNRLSLTTKDI